MDDDELIASLAGGDDMALRQLFDRHARWLAARLRKALPPDDVEDVLQETFLAVWKNAGTYQPGGTPAAWLWVIARNQAALLLRRRGPAIQALLDEGGPAGRAHGDQAQARLPAAEPRLLPGVLLVMVGLLALLPAARVPGVRGLPFAAGRRLTVVAAVGVACGVAASGTAFWMAGTAQYSLTTGWEIPALHDAADDQPIPYSPDCTGGAFKVRIHPAFEPYLGAMSAALQPAAAEIAGLPGAPVRAEMTLGYTQPAVAGTTSVFDYSVEQEGFGGASFWATPAIARTAAWEQGEQQDFITWFVSGPAEQDSPGTPAQEAVAIALLAKIGAPVPQYPQFSQPGTQPGTQLGASSTSGASGTQPAASAAQITAAARGFESLSSAARHAWLAANIAALRSGTITLAQIP